MGWLADDKTKVVGTYPPRKRGWTGYVEKDTAGQTNIYSVEVSVLLSLDLQFLSQIVMRVSVCERERGTIIHSTHLALGISLIDCCFQPAVYVAESAISSGTAGSSADGAENTAAIAAGLALISVAAASSILLQVGKNSPQVEQTLEYNGPALSYYINKFKPPEVIQAAVQPSNSEPQSFLTQNSTAEVLQLREESQIQEPRLGDPEIVS